MKNLSAAGFCHTVYTMVAATFKYTYRPLWAMLQIKEQDHFIAILDFLSINVMKYIDL